MLDTSHTKFVILIYDLTNNKLLLSPNINSNIYFIDKIIQKDPLCWYKNKNL